MESLDAPTTITQKLQKLANEDPTRAAFIFVDKDLNQRVITRQEMWDIPRKFAAVLKRLGLSKGDVVCNTLVNSPERLLTYFGTLASGATPSHGQLFLADGEDLIRNLKESKTKAIIYDPRDQNGARRILEKVKFTDETTGSCRYKGLPDLTHIIEIEARGLEESQRWMHLIDQEKDMFVDESISKGDIAIIFVTSGTTGFSKLVPRRHGELMNCHLEKETSANSCEDVVSFNMQSMGWSGGFPRLYFRYGCRRVLVDLTNGLPDNMTLGAFMINIFNQAHVNSSFMIPRDIQHILDAYHEGFRINNLLEELHTGGGPVYNTIMDAIGKIARTVVVVYGGTEFGYGSTMVVKNKSDYQNMCSGYPTSCQLKIVGDDDRELETGEKGEILVTSATIFKGYYKNPTKTAESFTKDGWYRTGDIGYFNREGQLFVQCRKADAITKDGFTHYPGWMEQLVSKHPGIEKSAVIGIPDPVHHEEICLCIKLMPGTKLSADELRDYCKTLFITDENDKMTPLPKHFLIFDEFITNTYGKVDRLKMREEVLKRISKIE